MNFNAHSNLEGLHAFLSASSYHWINYDDAKVAEKYITARAKELGTRKHEFAAEAIELGIKLPKTKNTLSMYVNDCIGYGMKPEQILVYSMNCFGTADAISFKKNKLKIFDLKTGITPTKTIQLKIYAALFCLEYKVSPFDIEEIEVRIYQNNEVVIEFPEAKEIREIMDIIVNHDMVIENIKTKEG